MDGDNSQGTVRFIVNGLRLGTQGSPRGYDGRFDLSEVNPLCLQENADDHWTAGWSCVRYQGVLARCQHLEAGRSALERRQRQ